MPVVTYAPAPKVLLIADPILLLGQSAGLRLRMGLQTGALKGSLGDNFLA
jgi:hypothetical protein